MTAIKNGNFNDNQGPQSKAYLFLIGIGIFLIVVAIVLYPQVRRIMEAENAFADLIFTSTPEPLPPSATPALETAQPTASSPPPTVEFSAYPNQFGTLVLSIREGVDSHLFAYQPFLEDFSGEGFSGLPLTRLTSGSHQDITPDVSEDGTRIAFSSNRDGPWDIYILDLRSGEVERFTESAAYDGNPSWSPDGLWLAYESYQGGNLEIMIQDVDKTSGPIPLTRDPAADFAPDWSAQGRRISFISDRSGREEVWYADLDSPQQEKAVAINNLPARHVQHPSWSSDGRYLVWGLITEQGSHNLVSWDSLDPDSPPIFLGSGDWPLWGGDDEILYSLIEQHDQTYLTSYAGLQDPPLVALPAIRLPGAVEGISWVEGNNYPLFTNLDPGPGPTPILEADHQSSEPTQGLPKNIVEIRDLSAPYPALSEDAGGSFTSLRAAVRDQAGWDFLSSLDNAFVPLDQPLEPGVNLHWLYTGRGILLNDLPRVADWLALTREQYGADIYWRVYIRAYNQQGFQGRPLQMKVWDLSARYSGNNADYENGGALSAEIPPGYWVDFTALAEAYGWTRFPTETYWQWSELASRYQYFAYSEEMDLESALLELYSPIQIQNLISNPSP